jgi:hypothetical protein
MLGVVHEDLAAREEATPKERRAALEQAVATFREGAEVYGTLEKDGRLLKIHASAPKRLRDRAAACEERLAALPPDPK